MKLNIGLFGIDFEGIENNQYTRYGTGGSGTINIGGHEYLIQCPDVIDENTTFYVAGRGAGGIGDTYSTLDAAKGKNVIVIAPVYQKPGDYSGSINVANELADHFGIDANVSFSGHSNSGPQCMEAAQEYIRSTGNPTTIVLNDPSVMGGSDSNIDYSVFKDSVIIDYAPNGGGATANYMGRLKEAAANGATVILAYYNNGDHGSADDISAVMGVYDPANMTLVDSIAYANGSWNATANMTYMWMDENGNLHKFKDAAEAQAYYDEAMSLVGGTSNVEKLRAKYDNLADFASHYKSRNSDTLASNLSYVANSMNSVKGLITEHTNMNYTGGSGEAAIVGAMYDAANYYGSITNVLYGNLSAEADAVYAIANQIYKMDQAGSIISESTLTDGVKGLYSSSSPDMDAALQNLRDTSASLYDTAKTAVTTSGIYDSLTTVLTDSPSAGSVGRISISSLENAIDSIVPVLDEGVAEAQALKASVSDFMSGIGASNILQGDIWNEVKTNMLNYENLLDCNMKASEHISKAIKVAMGAVTKYIQDAESSIAAVEGTDYGSFAESGELDDSKLPEISRTITTITNAIADLEDRIEAIEAANAACEAAPEPKSCTITDTSHMRTTLQKYKSDKEILDTYKGILEGFAPVVADAQNLINEAINDVKDMYEKPNTDTAGNQYFLADFELNLSSYDNLKDSAENYIGLIDDYYAARHPSEDPSLTDSADTRTTSGTQAPGTTGSQSPGTSGGNPGTSGGTPTTTTPSTTTTTPSKEDEETKKKKEEEEAKKKQEEEEAARVKAAAEAQRKAAEESAKRGTSTTTTTTKIDTEAKKAAEEAARRAAEAAAATTKKTTSGENARVIQTSTKTDEDGLTKLGIDKNPTNYSPRGGYGYTNSLGDSSTDDIVTDSPLIIEPTTEPTMEDYTESVITEPIIDEPVTVKEVEEVQPENKGLKTMGIAAGIGLTVGAAALGAHALVKDKEDDDEEDYGYDK